MSPIIEESRCDSAVEDAIVEINRKKLVNEDNTPISHTDLESYFGNKFSRGIQAAWSRYIQARKNREEEEQEQERKKEQLAIERQEEHKRELASLAPIAPFESPLVMPELTLPSPIPIITRKSFWRKALEFIFGR